MNWIAQLELAKRIHDEMRLKHGWSLRELESLSLALPMAEVHLYYKIQLKLGDRAQSRLIVWLRPAGLEFHCVFCKGGRIATEMRWTMPLVSLVNGKIVRIPDWLMMKIGSEIPDETALKVPVSTE